MGAGLAPQASSAASLGYAVTVDTGLIESGQRVAVDAAGNAFVIANPLDGFNDALILKFDPDGTVLFSTWLRGTAVDFATDIAVDAAGDVLVTGWTASDDFPIFNALQGQLLGVTDAFLTKLAGDDGRILFSTYLGGSNGEQGFGLTIDPAGDIVVTGSTNSVDFPTVDPFQAELNLLTCFCTDAFVTRLSADGRQILYSTYFGGDMDDAGRAVGVDAAGAIYFSGETESEDLPLQGALYPTYGGGQDAFAAALVEAGDALVYSTYLGGDDWDLLSGMATAPDGTVSIVGSTRSADFPTSPGAFEETFVGGLNACGDPFEGMHNCDDFYVTRILPDGSGLVFSTFVGGTDDDFGSDITLDAQGRATFVGDTASPDFPGTPSPLRFAIVVSQLSAAGDSLHTIEISSPVYNQGHGIALRDGNLYLAAAQNVPSDIFVARVDLSAPFVQ